MVARRKKAGRIISVLDLGFEDAKRLHDLASKRQHRKKHFMGIEWTKQKGLTTRRHNLKLVWGDVLNKLKRLPAESVRVMTADFLFTEFKRGGLQASDFGGAEWMVAKHFQRERRRVVQEVERVLVPRGRFLVIEYNKNLHLVKKLFAGTGFQYTVRPVSEREMGKTTFLKEVKKFMQEKSGPREREMVQPMRIIAVKPS